MSADPDDMSSSLYFLSTQIQSRYEEHEENDRKNTMLQMFKRATPSLNAPTAHSMKRKRRAVCQKTKPSTTISGFVRETLGNGKKSDHKSILDFFSGDKEKVDDFIQRIESATNTSHPLSRSSSSALFSESEWRTLLESIKLKYPNLSRSHRKTLKAVSRRLDELRKRESALSRSNTQDLDQMWSQALRQPSDKLSTEDMKWLYDLDSDDINEASGDFPSDEERSYSVTLSQVFNGNSDEKGSSKSSGSESENECLGGLPHLDDNVSRVDQFQLREYLPIPNSESEPEELSAEDYIAYSKVSNDVSGVSLTKMQTSLNVEDTEKPDEILSHQRQDSLDVLTSISFAPTYRKPDSGDKVITQVKESALSSPCKDTFKTPQKWSKNLVITSSPPSSNNTSQKKDSPFFSASESPLKERIRVGNSPRKLNWPIKIVGLNSPTKIPNSGNLVFPESPTKLGTAESILTRIESSPIKINSPIEIAGTPSRDLVSLEIESQIKSLKNSFNSTSLWKAPPNDWDVHKSPDGEFYTKDSQEAYLTAPTGHQRSIPESQNSDISLLMSPRKRTRYVTSTLVVHGVEVLQKNTAELKIATVAAPELNDVIPDSEDDLGDVINVEITRPFDVPATPQSPILQVPSSPGV